MAFGGVADDYTVTSWRAEDGLPQNSVNAIAQTRDGYLWVGTYNGLARFDGVRFTKFSVKDGLRSPQIFRLLEDSSGDLWIGTLGGGLSRYHAGRFTTFTPQDGLADEAVVSLAEDGSRRLWVGTMRGLSVWDGNRLAVVNGSNALPGGGEWVVRTGPDGSVWARRLAISGNLVKGPGNGSLRG
ncbi:MAG: hypothetical protein L0Y58_19150 [Verrucomicrobia subdivision 3 bacterium]|nr:hypothetical protein [Limisphaerales bacterium]